MLSKEGNELITCTGPGTPMGNAMRRYWVPARLSSEIDEPDGPVRVKLLGEELSRSATTTAASAWSRNSARTAACRSFSGATRNAACDASITAGNST